MDKNSSELLLVQPVDANEDDVSIRTALIRKWVISPSISWKYADGRHPSISLTTRLQDAHIYVMRRTFLDLLASRRAKDLDSLREQVIPWLIKTAWQKGLAQRYSPSKCATRL
jgi:translation initiation factor eIF-2B subunit gamma